MNESPFPNDQAHPRYQCRLIGGPAHGHVTEVSAGRMAVCVYVGEFNPHAQRDPDEISIDSYVIVGPLAPGDRECVVAVHKDELSNFMSRLWKGVCDE